MAQRPHRPSSTGRVWLEGLCYSQVCPLSLPFQNSNTREDVLTKANRQGAQGILDGASKAMLENEFGTTRDEDVVQQILEKGEIQETTVRHSLSLSL